MGRKVKKPEDVYTPETTDKREKCQKRDSFQPMFKYYNSQLFNHKLLFGFCHKFKDCKNGCKDIEDPLIYFAKGGTAEKLIKSGAVNDIDGNVDGRLLLIHWRWPFKGEVADLRSFRPHPDEHWTRKDFEDEWADMKVNPQYFRIPAARMQVINEMIANSRLIYTQFQIKVRNEAQKQELRQLTIKCTVRKRFKCQFCKLVALPFPMECQTEGGHHYSHYFCVVEACNVIEESKLMTVNSIICKDNKTPNHTKCERPLPILISENNLPTIKDMLLLWQGTEPCEKCGYKRFLGGVHKCKDQFNGIEWITEFIRKVDMDLEKEFKDAEVIDLTDKSSPKEVMSQKDKTEGQTKQSSQKSEKTVKRDTSGKYKSTKTTSSASQEKRNIFAAHSYSGTPAASTSTSTPKPPKRKTQTAKSKSKSKTNKQDKGIKRKKVIESSDEVIESDED